jgi:hypothetical protein
LQALICCPEQTITDRSTHPGKRGIKKREEEEEKEYEGREENKEAGSMNSICQKA